MQLLKTLYRALAFLTFNTLLLLLLVEGGAGLWLNLRAPAPSDAYWQEFAASDETQYAPYVIWRGSSYDGQLITVNAEGLRETPGAACDADAVRVFTFGGSTMWGHGVADTETIPAYLQAGLAAQLDTPICVINFGQKAFVSTQGLIELTHQLQADNVPDIVIFYDGINDIGATLTNGNAQGHLQMDEIALKLEHPFLHNLRDTNTLRLLAHWHAPNSLPTLDDNTRAQLANELVQTYLETYRIVGALAETYQFEYYFFWQPYISVHPKPFTPAEQVLFDQVLPPVNALTQTVYSKIATLISPDPGYAQLHDLSPLFETTPTRVWLDTVHLNANGNALVAEGMLNTLLP